MAAESEPIMSESLMSEPMMSIDLVAIDDPVDQPLFDTSSDGTGGVDVCYFGSAEYGYGSMWSVVDQIQARELWQRGVTGEGIDVAVIDTGVAPVPAPSGADKVVAMVDLSFEAGVPEAQYLDTNGHGTHMAGIIAGRDPGADPATAHLRPDEFVGVAPGAGIVSVKVGDNTGAVDVSQVIAGIDWVVQHRNDGDLNIRVINLSYGTDGTQHYTEDPLQNAVENAWAHGIVVVTATSNDGHAEKGLSNPALSPYVIAVSPSEIGTDRVVKVGHYATSGDGDRNPDVVAPGTSIESLRVPGSRIATEHPEGHVSETLFRGTGSSQASAVVSGAVALLLQDRPELTPDQVKALLNDTAFTIGRSPKVEGNGFINVAAAAAAPVPTVTQNYEPSHGTGSLEAARGTHHVSLDGVMLEGEITAWGDQWNGETWAETSTLGSSWTGGEWTGGEWTGSSWTGSSWTGSSWTGSSWTGSSWTGSSWTGSSWTGSSWTRAGWQ